MGAKVSAEMKHALTLVVEKGKAVKESARIAGLDASSVYKALRRIERAAGRAATRKPSPRKFRLNTAGSLPPHDTRP